MRLIAQSALRNVSRMVHLSSIERRGTSQTLPKFESYRCSRNSLNFLTKVRNAYEQFHGIGRPHVEIRPADRAIAEMIGLAFCDVIGIETDGAVADHHSSSGSNA
jgi:hypothetical protein